MATEIPENLSDAEYCPLPRRLLAMLYDGLVLLALLILASAAALPFGSPDKVALRDFWFTLWLLLVCFAYLGGFWRYGGLWCLIADFDLGSAFGAEGNIRS